jgi:hypothetical protein
MNGMARESWVFGKLGGSMRRKHLFLRALGCLGLAALAWMGVARTIGAIDPGDHLPHGQFLVEEATQEIDRRVQALAAGGYGRETLYNGLGELLEWTETYANDRVQGHFALTDPRGIMITDGIADTLSTRFYDLLARYVELHPDEVLSESRQALEIVYASVPLPPGRFLGFHNQRMLTIYFAQAETLLTMPTLRDPEGVQDGFLRHAWDFAQLYSQVHRDAGERYLCRIDQEDWIVKRMQCPHCGTLGYEFKNQRMGMNQIPTDECTAILAKRSAKTPEEIIERINCYHWGHIFDVQCPACADSVTFSVPLPYYKALQRDLATGKGTLNTEELIQEP